MVIPTIGSRQTDDPFSGTDLTRDGHCLKGDYHISDGDKATFPTDMCHQYVSGGTHPSQLTSRLGSEQRERMQVVEFPCLAREKRLDKFLL